ncbi:ABC transporter substrate-binding protein [Amycolatopsis sp. cg5]|uniref:ABC transporter substrate-binding protein n=1 Tax=Amycolatopsis sp. cg5 TaxID=3238802 RepID=UPI003524A11E
MSGFLRRRTILRGIGATALSVTAGRAKVADGLKVGVLTDLSGPSRLHGQRQFQGIEAAAERARVTLVVRDTRGGGGGGDLAVAGHGARELVGEGVAAIVGTSSGRTAAPVLELASQAGIPLIMPFAGVDQAVPQHFAFRSGPTADQVMQTMADDLARTGHRTVAIITSTSSNEDERLRVLTLQLGQAGPAVAAVVRYQEPLTDFITPITAAVSAKPDALIFWGMPPNNGIAAHEARGIGWTGSLYFGSAAATPLFLDGAGPAAEGVRVIGHWAMSAREAPRTLSNYNEMIAFVRQFEQTRGPIGAFACYGADAVTLIHRAARDGHDPAAIRTALENTVHQGVTGSYRFSPDHHSGLSDDSLVVLTVTNGAWTLAP